MSQYVGCGTIFKVTPSGTFTVLYTFSIDGKTGAGPSDLVFGNDGYLHGTTSFGGANGKGTIFKISTSGTFTMLYSLTAADGQYASPLTKAPDGSFYGVTPYSGSAGYGTIFKFVP